jgi:spore cortex formation protein SpoVR/YcgB (stage V sporulation)
MRRKIELTVNAMSDFFLSLKKSFVMNQNKRIIPKAENNPITFVENTGLNLKRNKKDIIKIHRKLVYPSTGG